MPTHQTADKYRCQCKSGYSRNQQEENTARSACIPINRCEKFTSPCGPNSACSFTGLFSFQTLVNPHELQFAFAVNLRSQSTMLAIHFSNNALQTNVGPGLFNCTCDDGFISTSGSNRVSNNCALYHAVAHNRSFSLKLRSLWFTCLCLLCAHVLIFTFLFS